MTQDPQPPLTCIDKLKALHLIYCTETGNALSLTHHRQDLWQRWERNQWTAEDLRLVIRYIKKQYYRRDRPEIVRCMLHFKKLIEPEYRETGLDYSYFEQELCDAKAEQRNSIPPRTTRDAVLTATHRPTTQEQKAQEARVRTPKEILERGYEQLRKVIE